MFRGGMKIRKGGKDMHEVLTQIGKIGIVPVVKIEHAEDAVPLAKALCAGGIPCAEITFRTSAAEESIRRIAQEVPQMLVGAGTVLTPEQADAAVNAGAKFIVSPGLNPKVVAHCVEKGYPITPGTSSPSDVEQALSFGLEVVKFFPAEAAGGIGMIKAMSAPYGGVKFMPTGGVNAKNLRSYLDFSKVLACGGSWMVPADLLNNKEFAEIERLTREAVETMLGFELAHVGINAQNEEEADQTAEAFSALFGFEKKSGNSSVFAGTAVEVMKTPYLGQHGHIAIATNYLERAMYYLESKGIKLDYDTQKFDAKGNLIAIYLKKEVNGFAVHLVQKK